ncbi:M14 family metallopeptidase [Tautonia marina]|uniref:M14 family metallopeptidase n=1 Tax=Tautonia marina TaxID=2653855 RepID=UPI001375B8DC|nr:M14 family metallopeptidase [Tautonia marina]
MITQRIGAPATLLPLLVLVVLSLPGSTRADDAPAPSLVPEGYLDADTLTKRLQDLAEAHPDALSLRSIAKTGEGRDVWLVTLGVRPDEQDDEAHRPPAVLIVGNLEADHLVGSQVALGLIERLADPDEEDEAIATLLDRYTVYVVPRLNPDGAERLFETPRQAIRTNLTATDEDRDGTSDEDGPDDVDGDRLILQMRVKDAEATLVPDEDDPRILRPAKAAEGERAIYSESDEGTDRDGDGERNEDPAGGVNLNRNWPHAWTELNDQTGYSPASEPEVRGLIQFCYDHPEISVVWTFTLHDSLRTEPKKPESKLADADLPYFVALSKAYRESIAPPKEDEENEEPKEEPDTEEPTETSDPAPIPDGADPLAGLPEAVRNRVIEAFEALPENEQNRLMTDFENASPLERAGMLAQFVASLDADEDEPESPKEAAKKTGEGLAPSNSSSLGATTDGAMSEWAYDQFGAVAIASSLWPGPTLTEPAEGEEKPPTDGEKRWLFWNDTVMGGRAFKDFDEVEHPTLGTVEIGGWLPGVRVNPPIEEVEGITEAQYRFLTDLAGRMTTLEIVDVKVEPRGGDVFGVSARVENPGYFPTALAQGVTTRQAAPIVVRPVLGEAKLLGGPIVDRIDRLAGSGDSKEYRWLILAPEGVEAIAIEASSPRAGKVVAEVGLPREPRR